jgi:hypothetical protein
MRDSRSADESPHVQRNAREALLTRLLVEAQGRAGDATGDVMDPHRPRRRPGREALWW